MRNLSLSVAAIFTMLLSGCGTTGGGEKPYQLEEVSERSVAYVKSTRCAYGEPGEVDSKNLIALAIPVIANAAYDGVVNFVKELNEKSSADYIATGLAELKLGRCISIVRGTIVNSSEKSDLKKENEKVAEWLSGDVLRDDLSLKDVPPFLVELAVSEAASGGVVLQPHYILFQESASKYFKKAKKNIGVVLVLREQLVETSDADSVKEGAEYVFAMDFGDVMPGTYLKGRQSFPEMVAVLPKEDISKGKAFNAYAIVVEADEPSKIVELIATVVEKAKEDVLKKVPNGT